MGKSTKVTFNVKASGKAKVSINVTTNEVKSKKRRPNGVIVYRGPSMLDGRPIMAVAVGLDVRSKNAKVGKGVIPVYILGDDKADPVLAVEVGADKSVCGDCPHRGTTCYVNIVQAPLAVYRAAKRGTYPTFHLHLFKNRTIRFGAYGDPAAVPLRVWDLLAGVAKGWLGYTHQWRVCDHRYSRYCMASVETPLQREQAVGMGWRTFRVRLDSQPVGEGEFICPASEEAGKRLTCEECGACWGSREGGRNASPVIVFHGPHIAGDYRHKMYERLMGRLLGEEERRRPLPMVN